MTPPSVAADLILAARGGDQSALDRLIRDHLGLVFNIAARTLPRADADDVTQETMIRAVAGLPGLRDPNSFRSWLVAIAVRETRRRGNRLGADQQRITFADTDDLVAVEAGVEDHVVHRVDVARQRRMLTAATSWLDPDDRELLGLWWLTQVGTMSSAEMASALGISAAHARVRLQRLRTRLHAGRLIAEAVAALDTPHKCDDLRALVKGWDGSPAPVWRKRLTRHVDDCARCGAPFPALLPPERLLLTVPLLVPPERLFDTIVAGHEMVPSSADGPQHRGRGRRGVVAAAAVLAVALAVGLFVVDRSPAPVVVTAPPPATSAPAHSAGPSPSPPAPTSTVAIGAGAGSGGPSWSARQLPPTDGGRYLYVSGRGDDGNSGRTRDEALRTLRRAGELTEPGDTVLVDDGEYSDPGRNSVVTIERSGTPDRWITWAAFPGAHPVVHAAQWQGIWVHASYITVAGLTVTGMRAKLSPQQIAAAKNGDVSDPAVSNSCIAVTEQARADPPRRPTHVVVWGNTLTDCTLAGISVQYADHVTAAYNVTRRNGWYSPYGGSGISFSNLWNSDGRTDVKMVVRGNVSSENQNLVPCLCSGTTRKITDGNGIIIESLTNEDVHGAPLFQAPYTGRVLVENNVSYNNGGRGINVFKGAHIDIVNNTLYHDATHPAITTDLAITLADDVRVVNNIVVAGRGVPAAEVSGSSRVSFDHNLLAGSRSTPPDPNLLTSAPHFRDAADGDFRLRAGDPAIDSGTAKAAPGIDADRMPRTRPVDRGAYEVR
ncbi:Pectate lyase L [Actinoplanes sp. SE50]|uniref:sigma-70 family RNA polymerase sigma factor n=1 Tax=unclassified Actinoplanes TaxID=2626549 RepID=UPI00023ECA15|nr:MULTISPECIES: sigma-70 family RNA polymerase sigma factor [unclassified Actinoplanes]AEV87100.1 Pectate lyase L [Actinoplanes sp. SE50/110]ATO85498.1 Pectate lyase L [Actinoplanes sp. SE50]SLM02910.1 Pectate lyase L [Actinoplanes sp. SE50/110]